MTRIRLEVGAGELIDRLTILEIERGHARSSLQKARVERELGRVAHACTRAGVLTEGLEPFITRLRTVNRMLWKIEDEIRHCELIGDFGPRFVRLARSIYKRNDQRAGIKRSIDRRCGSAVTEEKIYTRPS